MYLTLPSNSSLSVYPNNTLGEYTTVLPMDVDLRDHELGLVEMVYPNSFFTVTKNDWIKCVPDSEDPFEIRFEDASFLGRADLANHMEDLFKKFGPPRHIVNVTTSRDKKIEIISTFAGSIEASKELAGMLGLKYPRFLMGVDTPFSGEYEIDLSRGLTSFFIYTNIVHPRIVGDTQSPLLRIVPISGHRGQIISETFDNVQYVPINRANVREINILIRDQGGKVVPFKRGSLSLTLHARKIK